MTGSRRQKITHDVITVGSAVVDHYVRSPAFEIKAKAGAPDGFDACVPLGAKIPLSDMVVESGGGATNAAVTFARLGFRTATICRVGPGLHGDFVIRRLKDEGVETSLVQRDSSVLTGQSIIFVAGAGYRSILVHRGASTEVNHRAIHWTTLSPRWFYVTSLNGDLGLLSLILDRAEQVGARVAWNPGEAELEKGLTRLMPFIRRVDIFDLNREEASLLTDKPKRHLEDHLRVLGDLPRIAFLLSDGAHGAYLTSRGCTWFCPAPPGKRVNTTGAGDALGSGLAAAFLHTCDLGLSFKIAMLNAYGVTTHMGAKAGILQKWPSERELKRIKIRSVQL